MALKITKCGIKKFGKMIIFPLISGIAMIMSILFLKIYINIRGIKGFLLFVIVGSLAYFSMIYLLDRFLNYGMYPLVTKCLDELGW